MMVKAKGHNSIHSLNLSGLYKNFIHLGININLHEIEYENYNRFVEQNFSEKSNVTEVAFDNTLNSKGDGLSFQFGLIAKINKNIRLGIYYDSPQWIKIKEKYKQEIVVDYIENTSYVTEKIKPDIITFYDPYNIQIPSKKNISLAYIFKRGLLNIDYGIKNYGKTIFKDPSNKTSNYFNNLNDQINSELKSTNNLRIGGEYIIGLFSIRAGFFNEKSFQNKININNSAVSWGLGLNFKRSSIDIAFVENKTKNSYNLFPVELTNKYYVNKVKNQIIFTYNLKL
jgi:long-subunit fatty acid transport protein